MTIIWGNKTENKSIIKLIITTTNNKKIAD